MENRLKFGDYVKINDSEGFFKDIVGRVVDFAQDTTWGENPGGQTWAAGSSSYTMTFKNFYIVRIEIDGIGYNKQISEDELEKITAIGYMKNKKEKKK